jgi:hypothetical protein
MKITIIIVLLIIVILQYFIIASKKRTLMHKIALIRVLRYRLDDNQDNSKNRLISSEGMPKYENPPKPPQKIVDKIPINDVKKIIMDVLRDIPNIKGNWYAYADRIIANYILSKEQPEKKEYEVPKFGYRIKATDLVASSKFRESFDRINNESGSCTTCKFISGNSCTVGTYYAEKGIDTICFEGELWQPKKTEETKRWNEELPQNKLRDIDDDTINEVF